MVNSILLPNYRYYSPTVIIFRPLKRFTFVTNDVPDINGRRHHHHHHHHHPITTRQNLLLLLMPTSTRIWFQPIRFAIVLKKPTPPRDSVIILQSCLCSIATQNPPSPPTTVRCFCQGQIDLVAKRDWHRCQS